MAPIPETRYVTSGNLTIAYQVLGDGPLDLVFLPDWWNHLEAQWDEPVSERFLRRLASFSRLLVFDKRGTGLSDPVPLGGLPTIEEWSDDLRIALDAADMPSAALVCASGSTALGLTFAAQFPHRVSALVTIDGTACVPRREDYPEGVRQDLLDWAVAYASDVWGTGEDLELYGPSRAEDPAFKQWRARLERLAASPGTMRAMMRMMVDLDVRSVLGSVRAPMLAIHRAGDQWLRPGHSLYLASHVEGARYLELPGADHMWLGRDSERLLDEIEDFLTGTTSPPEPDRVLTTVMFTDVVGSTERAVTLGDADWRALLDRHDAAVRRQLDRARGHEIKTMGDGFFVSFDGPARAVRCGHAIVETVRGLGLEVRVGVHTGECELRDGDLGGVAVHIAARIGALAGAGEVLVSSTVKDLVAGSGISFEHRGEAQLKGIPETWNLYRAISG